jgi:hypothetical protein
VAGVGDADQALARGRARRSRLLAVVATTLSACAPEHERRLERGPGGHAAGRHRDQHLGDAAAALDRTAAGAVAGHADARAVDVVGFRKASSPAGALMPPTIVVEVGGELAAGATCTPHSEPSRSLQPQARVIGRDHDEAAARPVRDLLERLRAKARRAVHEHHRAGRGRGRRRAAGRGEQSQSCHGFFASGTLPCSRRAASCGCRSAIGSVPASLPGVAGYHTSTVSPRPSPCAHRPATARATSCPPGQPAARAPSQPTACAPVGSPELVSLVGVVLVGISAVLSASLVLAESAEVVGPAGPAVVAESSAVDADSPELASFDPPPGQAVRNRASAVHGERNRCMARPRAMARMTACTPPGCQTTASRGGLAWGPAGDDHPGAAGSRTRRWWGDSGSFGAVGVRVAGREGHVSIDMFDRTCLQRDRVRLRSSRWPQRAAAPREPTPVTVRAFGRLAVVASPADSL